MKGGIKMPKKIYVWGVDLQGVQAIRDQVADWAEIVELSELPERAPDGLLIVINNQEFHEWADEAREMADESRPCPVLAFEPVDYSYTIAINEWKYVDGYIGPDNWDELENFLELDCEHVHNEEHTGVFGFW